MIYNAAKAFFVLMALIFLSATVQSALVLDASSGNITFNTSGSSRMILDSYGRLGVNTTSPTYTMDVSGIGHFNDGVSVFTTSGQESRSMISGQRYFNSASAANYYGINLDAYLNGSGATSSVTSGIFFSYGQQNTTGGITGVAGFPEVSGTYNVGSISGVTGTPKVTNAGANVTYSTGITARPQFTAGTIGNLYGFRAMTDIISGGTATNYYGIYLQNISPGRVTNNYGLYIAVQDGGSSNNYGIYAVSGDNYLGGKLYVNGSLRTNITSCSGELETDSTGIVVCGTSASGGNTTLEMRNAVNISAQYNFYSSDLVCTDCIGTTEIADSYLLNNGDTGTGTYTFDTNTLHVDSGSHRVGIGTTGPNYKLDITGNASFSSGIRAGKVYLGGGIPVADCNNYQDEICGDGNLWIGAGTAGSIYFEDIINALDVDTGIVADEILRVDDGNTNDGTAPDIYFGAFGTAEGIGSKRTAGGNQYGLDLYTSSTPRITIENGGNVGIGTSDPQYPFHVNGNSYLGGSVFINDANFVAYLSPNPTIFFDAYNDYMGYNRTSDFFYWGIGGFGNEKMRLTSDGRLGLGTTAPNGQLHINDQASNNISLILENADDIGGIELESQSATASGEGILNLGINTNRGIPEKVANATGAWFRVDTRAANPHFGWFWEGQGSDVETEIASLSKSGDMSVNGTIKMGNTAATCDSTVRGQMRFVASAAGSDDLLYICMKKADNSYAWVLVARGG